MEKEKGISREKQTKILMISSRPHKDTIITCIQAECDDFIVKNALLFPHMKMPRA